MKKRREQLDLGLGSEKPTGPERTLEVNCLNCGAKFVAYYGYDEENVETVEVKAALGMALNCNFLVIDPT